MAHSFACECVLYICIVYVHMYVCVHHTMLTHRPEEDAGFHTLTLSVLSSEIGSLTKPGTRLPSGKPK